MSTPLTCTLWLQSNGDSTYWLQERINKLSKKYKTPAFEPHITLLNGLQASETELVSLTNTLGTSLHPFELILDKAGYRDHFYQALFLYVAKHKSLSEARVKACRLFDMQGTERYLPHVSLLYGDIPRKEKERMANLMGREFYIRFPVSKLVLMQTNGPPGQWKKIDTIALS